MKNFNKTNKITTEYIVDKEKRTIICIITTVNDVPLRLAKYDFKDEGYDEIDFDIRTYKGIAKCSPEDIWNEDYGKHLAEYRAQRLRQIDVNQELKKFISDVSRCANNLCWYGFLKEPHHPKENQSLNVKD